ncbi:DEAD/DEAH box helicase [Alteribacter populi]|uniref:DEAD/DEAH box helicase n=1 Tax=Alteribacter populi TaxID=2011011 RepID=UPI000BBB0F0A|nr:DEAD/DEAH box helicase [Alteribacter populi]
MFNVISEKEIEGYCSSPTVFSRGKSYFEEGAVEELSYDRELGHYHAIVSGMADYHVFIDYDETSGELDLTGVQCDCKAFDKYPGLCKHIAAVAITINNDHQPKRKRFSSEGAGVMRSNDGALSLIDSFHQVYERKKESLSEKETLHVEFILYLSTSWHGLTGSIDLEMKIGPKRRYVVKDIGEFLDAMEYGSAHRFSKLFTYHPSDYLFSQADMRVFHILRKIVQLEKDFTTFSFRATRTKDDKRKVTIPNPFLMELLQVLQQCTVTIENDIEFHTYYNSFEVYENPEKLPLQFELSYDPHNQSLFTLKWTNYDRTLMMGKNYNILFYRGAFFALTDEEKQVILTLYSSFGDQAQSVISIPKEQMMDFSSVVLPQLMTVGNVDVDSEIRQLIKAEPLVGKLYVDATEDAATAKLSFVYGDATISPFENSPSEGEEIVVRDMEKEMLLLSFIEKIPFKYNGNELFLDDWEEVLQFLLVDVPSLSEVMEVYTTSQVKQLIYSPAEQPRVHIEANERMNLLDVTFQFEGIDESEIEAMMTALAENKKYYKLSSGAYLNLQDDQFSNVKELIEQMPTPADGLFAQAQVPLLQAFQLDEASGNMVRKGRRFRELLERMYHPEDVEAVVPEDLNATMREYQKVGFRWLKTLSNYGFGGVLADDMGLGKTIQTIAFLLSEKQEQKGDRALIVCPSSLIYNWEREIQRFAPALSTAVITGHSADRVDLLEQSKAVDVVITSYPLLRRDMALYQGDVFSTFILDEAQYIKNDWTQTAKAVKSIRTKQAFALSGTPIENSLDELFSIFEVVMPGLFRDKKTFKNLKENEVAKRVRPFVLRRVKEDVLSDLPDKIENVQYTELNEEQKAVYLAQLQLLQNEVKNVIKEDSFQENRMKILAGLTRLRQICCHPQLFMENYQGSSGKLERLLEYLKEAIPSGKRVVIFSQFTKMLGMIREELEKLGWEYHYLDGKTPSNRRLAMTEEYNEGGKPLFLISLKAGGTGLNLTGGDTVILFDSWWNPAVEEQAADRVHRFGQKKVVQVLKLVTAGTIEEKIHQLQDQKRELMDKVIQTGETSITSLNKDDIQELLQV